MKAKKEQVWALPKKYVVARLDLPKSAFAAKKGDTTTITTSGSTCGIINFR